MKYGAGQIPNKLRTLYSPLICKKLDCFAIIGNYHAENGVVCSFMMMAMRFSES